MDNMRRFLGQKMQNNSTDKEKADAKSKPLSNRSLKHSLSMPLGAHSTIYQDVYPKRSGTKGKTRPEIKLLKPEPWSSGSMALLSFSDEIKETSYLERIPNNDHRQSHEDLIEQFPYVPTSIPAVSTPLNIRNDMCYNSHEWQRNSSFEVDPFRKSEIRLLQPPKQSRYQHSPFPVLGSRDAVAHADLLPENTTLGAIPSMKKSCSEYEAECEAMRRPSCHGRDAFTTIQPSSLPVHPPQSIRCRGRALAVDLDAHAVRNGAERQVFYQRSHAVAPQQAHIYNDSQDLGQSVAEPPAPLDTHGNSKLYQQSTPVSPQHDRSFRDPPESKYFRDCDAISRDTRFVADAKNSMLPTIKPTIPLKLPRNKLPQSSSVDIGMPIPLKPYMNPRKDPRNQVAIYPRVAYDGSIKLMTANDYPPSVDSRSRRAIKRKNLNPGPQL